MLGKTNQKEPSLYNAIYIMLMKEVKLINVGRSQNTGYTWMNDPSKKLDGQFLKQLICMSSLKIH